MYGLRLEWHVGWGSPAVFLIMPRKVHKSFVIDMECLANIAADEYYMVIGSAGMISTSLTNDQKIGFDLSSTRTAFPLEPRTLPLGQSSFALARPAY